MIKRVLQMLRINNIKISFSILLLFLIVSTNLGLAQEVDTTIIPAIDSSKVILLNTNYPGRSVSLTDVSHETAGEILENPFKVQVLYQGKEPLEGWPVYFTVISI